MDDRFACHGSGWQHRIVLAALNLGALLLGVATGGLTASLLSLAVGGLLSIAEVPSGDNIGLVIGILVGLAAGGWVSGKRAKHSSRFHGAVTGLALAFVMTAVARLGGSPAGTTTILWLAFVSVVVSAGSGWLAGRRKETPT